MKVRNPPDPPGFSVRKQPKREGFSVWPLAGMLLGPGGGLEGFGKSHRHGKVFNVKDGPGHE